MLNDLSKRASEGMFFWYQLCAPLLRFCRSVSGIKARTARAPYRTRSNHRSCFLFFRWLPVCCSEEGKHFQHVIGGVVWNYFVFEQLIVVAGGKREEDVALLQLVLCTLVGTN